MKRRGNKGSEFEFQLPHPSSSDLRGRQSVRATFKLSSKAIEALSILSLHLGIKQKSLFDHLLDDIDSLNVIAQQLQSETFRAPNRVQKTYVISRHTLSSLERASRDFDAPRDALVEYSIRRLLPVIANEREKHKKRKEVLRALRNYVKRGENLLRESKAMLGKEDPVYGKIAGSMGALINGLNHIEEFVEKGDVIEEF